MKGFVTMKLVINTQDGFVVDTRPLNLGQSKPQQPKK